MLEEAADGLEYIWAIEFVAATQAASPSLAARFVAESPAVLRRVRSMSDEEFEVVVAAIAAAPSMIALTADATAPIV